MRQSIASLMLLAALLGGCMSVPPSANRFGPDPSNPSAPEASAQRFRPRLVATTKTYLDPALGQGAGKMDMSKMEGMEGMDDSKMEGMESKGGASGGMQGMDHSKMKGTEGMDHSKMQGMESKPAASGGMEGMDHSKMSGMDAKQPSAAPPNKEALETEMKQTSDEMKKISDELKAKSDAAKRAEESSEKNHAATKPATSASGAYTCPMHPEIKETKPGNCPICGMTLIKKSAKPEGAKP